MMVGCRSSPARIAAAAPTAFAPFTDELVFFVPHGHALAGVDADGVAIDGLETEADGDVLRVRFVPQATGELTRTLAF